MKPEEIKTEPSAAMRTLAHTIREAHVALVDEGFTEHQALVIVGQILVVSTRPND